MCHRHSKRLPIQRGLKPSITVYCLSRFYGNSCTFLQNGSGRSRFSGVVPVSFRSQRTVKRTVILRLKNRFSRVIRMIRSVKRRLCGFVRVSGGCIYNRYLIFKRVKIVIERMEEVSPLGVPIFSVPFLNGVSSSFLFCIAASCK